MTASPPIPHSRPTVGEEEVRAVAEVIRAGQLALGERGALFERKLAEFVGVRGAVATSSGTAALHLALLALGAGRGDEVVIPSYTCAALLQGVRHAGARARLADVDPGTGNLTAAAVARSLSRRTRAVVLPHTFGRPAEVEAICALGPPVIEDLAESLGGSLGGRPLGSFGRAAICSFYATKLLAAGEGGAVLSDDPGILADAADRRAYDEREEDRLRFNYKMSELEAALGLTQLGRLPGFLARRRELAARYREALSGRGLGLASDPPGGTHAYHRFVVRLPAGLPLEPLLARLGARGVACRRPVFRPLHRVLGLAGFPGSEEAWGSHLSVPLYPSLTEGEVERILSALAAELPEVRG